MSRYVKTPYGGLSPRARNVLRQQIEAWTPESILEYIHQHGTLEFNDEQTKLTGLGSASDAFHFALRIHLPTLKTMIQEVKS